MEFCVWSAERTGAQSVPVAMSVCFKREKALHNVNVERKTTDIYANSSDDKRFFAVKNTAHCNRDGLRSSLYAFRNLTGKCL